MNQPHRDPGGSPSIVDQFRLATGSNWGQRQSPDVLNSILTHVNSARTRNNQIDRHHDLSLAIIEVWNTFVLQTNRETPGADEVLAQLTTAQIENEIELLFDRPCQRLAVYGTLKPGGSNERQLADIDGKWLDGIVRGIVEQPGEYLEFTWIDTADPVQVKVFSADKLPDHLDRLDEFEGPDYCRTLVPVSINGTLQICNIYEGLRRRK